MLEIQAREHPKARKCPFCHDELQEGQLSYRCAGCDAIYHSECIVANRRCATLGCAAPVVLVPAPRPKTLGLRIGYFLVAASFASIALSIAILQSASSAPPPGFIAAAVLVCGLSALGFLVAALGPDRPFSVARAAGRVLGRALRGVFRA